MKSRLGIGILALMVIGALVGMAIYAGFRIGRSGDTFLFYKINRADQLIYQWINKDQQTPDSEELKTVETEIDTTLLTVHFKSRKVSSVRTPYDGPYENNGGALDLYRDSVLVIDPKGQFFLGDSVDSFTLLNIAPPDTHSEKYQRFDGHPDYENTEFQKTPLKYNDVKYLESDQTGKILVSYTEFDDTDPCFRNVVAYVDIGLDTDIKSVDINEGAWKPLYKSEPCLPLTKSGSKAMFGEGAGGMIEVYDADTIFYANGDFLYKDIAQDPKGHYGKVLRIDVNTGAHQIHSSGFRNPKGLEFDLDGRLWLVENGPRGGDELNLLVENGNFGWPIESYGTDYYGGAMTFSASYGRHDKYIKPSYSWLPSVSPSEIIQLNNFHEYWDGDFIVSSLLAQNLYRIHVEQGETIFVEEIHFGERIRDIVQYRDQLVLFTDKMNIVFVSVGPIKIYDSLTGWFEQEYSSKDAKRLESSIGVCQQCHSFFGNDNSSAPNLQRVFADKLGSTPFQNYSSAFKGTDLVWDAALLKKFLKNPESVVPGTEMPNPGVGSDEDIESIVKFLQYLDTIK